MAKIDMVVLNDGESWSNVKGSYVLVDYDCDVDDTQIGAKIDLETIVNDYLQRHKAEYAYLNRNKQTVDDWLF